MLRKWAQAVQCLNTNGPPDIRIALGVASMYITHGGQLGGICHRKVTPAICMQCCAAGDYNDRCGEDG